MIENTKVRKNDSGNILNQKCSEDMTETSRYDFVISNVKDKK